VLTAALVAALLAVPAALPALPGDVTCLPGTTFCVVEVAQPGVPGGPGTGGGGGAGTAQGRQCVVATTGEVVPCLLAGWGWFSDEDSCYWMPVAEQVPDGAVWEGHYPDGAIWAVTCLTHAGTNGGWTWRAAPPPGYGGITVTPAQLAQRAVDQMALTGPAIELSIPADRFGVVGVPVWLWTEVSATTWGPNSATASVPGLSVTATARARQIVWDMGDGRTETCRNPGTAYHAGGVTSPTCQHIYEHPSGEQPDQAYPVTATTTWDVTWSGGGVSGSLTVTRTSTSSVRIGEVQVLVTT